MVYYRVQPHMDNANRWKAVPNRPGCKQISGFWVANELYTAAELRKLGYAEPPEFLERVEISRRKIYWFFGARFTDETGVKTA